MENSVKQDIFTVLECRVKDACNLKSVDFSGKIFGILEWIAVNESLRQFVSECLTDFNFETEFNRSVSGMRYGILVPSDKKKTVAFGFGLLYEMDSDKKLLPYILKKWYSDNDTDSAFDLFKNDVVFPFLNAVGEIYAKGQTGYSQPNPQKDKYSSLAISYVDEIIAQMAGNDKVCELCRQLKGKIINRADREETDFAFKSLKQAAGRKCHSTIAELESCLKRRG